MPEKRNPYRKGCDSEEGLMTDKTAFQALAALLLACIVPLGVRAQTPDLSTAPSDDLLKVYTQLRSLHGGGQGAVTENVVWKRDAATFTFVDGRISFAAPVEGHVLAAGFEGRGTFTLDPPTPIDQHQIARFAKSPKLADGFRSAVFFFTDDSWEDLQKLVNVRSGGDAGGNGAAIGEAE